MALRGAAQNEQRMQAIGVSPYPYKLTAFVISGVIAGLAGALQAASQNFISPTDMFWGRSGDLVVICVLGGVARVWGPVIGAALFFTLELSLGAMTKSWELPFGLIVIALATFANGGIIELLARLGLIQRVRVGGQH
jgi:branched-chain amino acid transport system permease protein